MTMKQRASWRRKSVAFTRLSLRDNEVDLARGSVGLALGLVAIPMMLEMSMESVFALVDIALVSRNLIFMAVVDALMLVSAGDIAGLFSVDADVIHYGANCL